jgi:hypothetical protein
MCDDVCVQDFGDESDHVVAIDRKKLIENTRRWGGFEYVYVADVEKYHIDEGNIVTMNFILIILLSC